MLTLDHSTQQAKTCLWLNLVSHYFRSVSSLPFFFLILSWKIWTLALPNKTKSNLCLTITSSDYSVVVGLWADKTSFHSQLCGWILNANHPQSPPSYLRVYSICSNARLFLTLDCLFQIRPFDLNEYCIKNGLLMGWGGEVCVLSPRLSLPLPLDRTSSTFLFIPKLKLNYFYNTFNTFRTIGKQIKSSQNLYKLVFSYLGDDSKATVRYFVFYFDYIQNILC